MKTFNEGSNIVATVNIRSEGVGTTPANVYWTLRNITADKTIVDWTQVSAAASLEIDIAAQYVRIEDDSNPREIQELTVPANYGTAGQVPEVVRWTVKNLSAFN